MLNNRTDFNFSINSVLVSRIGISRSSPNNSERSEAFTVLGSDAEIDSQSVFQSSILKSELTVNEGSHLETKIGTNVMDAFAIKDSHSDLEKDSKLEFAVGIV